MKGAIPLRPPPTYIALLCEKLTEFQNGTKASDIYFFKYFIDEIY